MPQIGETITYNATYTPGNATLPVTYSWSIAPVTAGVITPNNSSPSINIQWNEIGNHALQLNSTNCGGTKTHSQFINVTSVPTPVTPPVAPPVAPPPVYNKCLLNIQWNNPSVVCNGDNTSTVTVSVNGNNGETVQFSINSGEYFNANSGSNTYISTFDSNGDFFSYDARILGCSQSINSIVQVCQPVVTPVAAPVTPPVAPPVASPVTSPVVSPVSPPTVTCVPITEKGISAPGTIRAGETVTFTASYGSTNATSPIMYSWNTASSVDTIVGSSTNSSVNILIGNRSSYPDGQQFISCSIYNDCTPISALNYEFTVQAPCIPVSTFNYQVGQAFNPSGTVSIPLGAQRAIDINPTGSYTNPVTFKVVIYGNNNNFLYASDAPMAAGSLIPGSPLMYTFDDATATSIYISVWACGRTESFVSIPLSIYTP